MFEGAGESFSCEKRDQAWTLFTVNVVSDYNSRLPVEMGTMWGLRFLSLDGTHLRVPPAALYYRGIVPALHFLRQVAEHGMMRDYVCLTH